MDMKPFDLNHKLKNINMSQNIINSGGFCKICIFPKYQINFCGLEY